MSLEHIFEIADWKYEGVVAGIYIDPYLASHEKGESPLRGPAGCYGYAAMDGNRVVGLFEYYLHDDAMEIGLALAPSLVGKGWGTEFVLTGIQFGIRELGYTKPFIKLAVDMDNLPAIKVYEKAGFVRAGENGREVHMRWYL
jgi:ribosomal-protein-alanine N-acetyltransferase